MFKQSGTAISDTLHKDLFGKHGTGTFTLMEYFFLSMFVIVYTTLKTSGYKLNLSAGHPSTWLAHAMPNH